MAISMIGPVLSRVHQALRSHHQFHDIHYQCWQSERAAFLFLHANFAGRAAVPTGFGNGSAACQRADSRLL
jgi:hypothetical protein